MAEVLLFHHVQGLTEGVAALADEFRTAGHTVHVPDLFDGRTFETLDAGFGYLGSVGEDVLADRVRDVVDGLPAELVYAGISWGVVRAQRLAQTRPGARGALLYEACIPLTGEWAFGPWPDGVPVQVHGHDDDEFFAHEGDLDAARELVGTVGPDLGEVFVYPGDQHLFCDRSLPSYDEAATALLLRRSLELLARV